jgi:hypothetical protein
VTRSGRSRARPARGPSRPRPPGRRLGVAAAVLVAAVAVAVLVSRTQPRWSTDRARADARAQTQLARSIDAMCSGCHAPAPPDILPRAAWPHTLGGMYRIADDRAHTMPLPLETVTAWYVERAPARLPPAPGRVDAGPGGIAWEPAGWRPPGAGAAPHRVPTVGHVRAARLFGGSGLDLIVSDMASDRVYALRPYLPGSPAVVLGEVAQPTRVAVVDLDGDGMTDVVVAGVGRMRPTDDAVGSVVWLRRAGPDRFERIVLLDGVGRVGDVAAADVDGSGRVDLAVAVFGWRQGGALLRLENRGIAGGRPDFETHVLDARTGFTDVRIADMDGDGRPDIVALIAQEHQQVMVYWQEADGFRPEAVWSAPHPDWGLVGLEVVDFTGDGRPDIVVANGDGLDVTVAKPQHGVSLLENRGGRRFDYHRLTHMYGAYRAEPVDLTGDGRIGLLVAAYLPAHLNFGHPDPPEAVIWLERVGPTQLVRRVLKSEGPSHMTLTAGDLTGDGRADFAVGWMDLAFADTLQAHRGEPLRDWVTLWRNRGARPATDAPPRDALIDWSSPVPAPGAGEGGGAAGGTVRPGRPR